MQEIFKTVIPFFGRPENYTQMLSKLASFVFWECVISFYILTKSVKFENFLTYLPTNAIPKTAFPSQLQWLNPSIIIISLIIAFLSYFFQLHNQIQKPFKIRETFDREKIFIPLSGRVGKGLTKEKIARFNKKRAEVMQSVFYQFCSSTRSDSVVDKHNIVQALWIWSIFWALGEAVLILSLFSIAFLTFGLINNSLLYLLLAATCILAMYLLWPRLSGAARAEIEQIANDATAKAAVRKAISAL